MKHRTCLLLMSLFTFYYSLISLAQSKHFTLHALNAGLAADSKEIENLAKEEFINCAYNKHKTSFLSYSNNSSFYSIFRPRLEHSNGWYYPVGASNYCGYLSWLGFNSAFNGYHLAQDMCNAQGDPVYAIDYGEVIYSSKCIGGYGGPSGSTCGGAIAIQHRAKDGTWFTALYGHLDNPISAGTRVNAGDIVGYSNNWSPPHVHFGIRLGYDPDSANWPKGYTSSTSNTYGFTNPNTFLSNYSACKNGSSVNFRSNGGVPTHPNGTLIIGPSGGAVFLIQNGQKRPIVSEAVLNSLYQNGGFAFKDIVTVALDELNSYPEGQGIFSIQPSNGRSQPNGKLVKPVGSTLVAIISDGTRRPFPSSDTFTGLGYLFCNVIEIPDFYSYPEGAIITGGGAPPHFPPT